MIGRRKPNGGVMLPSPHAACRTRQREGSPPQRPDTGTLPSEGFSVTPAQIRPEHHAIALRMRSYTSSPGKTCCARGATGTCTRTCCATDYPFPCRRIFSIAECRRNHEPNGKRGVGALLALDLAGPKRSRAEQPDAFLPLSTLPILHEFDIEFLSLRKSV